MRVVIAGGSGFLGTALAARLAKEGHSVVILSRNATPHADAHIRYAHWEPDGGVGPWVREIEGVDAVVNLSGAGLADKRWSSARKRVLHDSRILPTRSLAAAVRAAKDKPKVFLQGSATGFYGSYVNGEEFDETSSPGSDFLGTMCVAWEAEAHPLDTLTRVVFLRTAPALARHSEILTKMSRPYRFFVGGPVASGRQQMSWIHLDDWTGIAIWALTNPALEGPINATAPNPVSNREFGKALGRALRRPSWLPVPGFALRIIFGELANEMLIRGQRVIPRRALDLGYQFRFTTVDAAIQDALAPKSE